MARWSEVLFLLSDLAGCGYPREMIEPPWPSKAALEKFDFQPIENVTGLHLFDQFGYYYGVSVGCNFDYTSDLAFDKFSGTASADGEKAAGDAIRNAILTEVERLHPGRPDSPEIAERLFWLRFEAKAEQGHAALAVSICDAMRPAARRAMLEVLEFSASFGLDRARPHANGGTAPPANMPSFAP